MSRASRVPRDESLSPELRKFHDQIERRSSYVDVNGNADFTTLKEDGNRAFVQTGNATGGLDHTPVDHGTISSGTLTVTPIDGFFQEVINDGEFTLDVPTDVWGSLVLHITNGSSAGDVNISSNFERKYPSGSFTTTEGDLFAVTIFCFGANGADYAVQPRQ